MCESTRYSNSNRYRHAGNSHLARSIVFHANRFGVPRDLLVSYVFRYISGSLAALYPADLAEASIAGIVHRFWEDDSDAESETE